MYIEGTMPWEGRSGSSAHPLVPLWDLLAFLVVALRLGFPSLHFRPLKLSFFLHSSQLSDQWCLELNCDLGTWFPAKPMSCEFSRAQKTAQATDPTQESPSLLTALFHWATAENSPSFHKTSGSEVCSCLLTGITWEVLIGARKVGWESSQGRKVMWKEPKSTSRKMIFLNCFWRTSEEHLPAGNWNGASFL